MRSLSFNCGRRSLETMKSRFTKYITPFLLIFSFLLGAIVPSKTAARMNASSARSAELTDLKIAVGAYEDGLYKIASDYLKSFLNKYPHSKYKLKVSILLAISLNKIGQKDAALKTYLSIIQNQNVSDTITLLQIHYAIYRLLYEKKALKKALSHLEFIVNVSFKKKIKSVVAYKAFMILAQYYQNENRYNKAIQLLNKLLSLNPPNPWNEKALLQKITLLSLKGQFLEINNEIEPVINKMQDLKGNNKTFYLFWALSNLKLKHFCQSQKAYSKLLKLYADTPTFTQVLTGYVVSSYNCFADEHRLRQIFLDLRKQFKNRPSVLFRIDYLEGLLYFNDGKYNKSKEIFTKTLQHFPDHPKVPEILLKLDKIFISLNKPQAWENLLKKIYNGKKYSQETKEIASLLLGNIYFSRRKYENALPFYFSVINKKKFRRFCLKRIVLCYYYLEKFKEAKTNLGILLLENPHLSEQPDILFLRADLFLRLNEPQKALPLLKKLSQTSHTKENIWQQKAKLELGKIYFTRGDYRRAKQYFTDVFKNASGENNKEASFYLGLITNQEKNLELAETYFQIASLSENPNIRVEALFRLGRVSKEAKSYTECVKIFQRIIKKYPSQNKWHQLSILELSEIYITLHDYKKATVMLQGLLKTTEDPDIKKQASKLLKRIEDTKARS